MSKKDLENIVKGQGVNAFAPGPQPARKRRVASKSTRQKDAVSTEKSSKTETVAEDLETSIYTLADPYVTGLQATDETLYMIEDVTGGAAEYLIVWDFEIDAGKESREVFERDDVILLHVYGAASRTLTQLEADFSLEVLAIDESTNDKLNKYSQSFSGNLEHGVFMITFSFKASTKGIFCLRTLIQLEKADHFQVCEGPCFRVM